MTTWLNGGRGWLSDAAAASIHRMDAAYGGYVPINSAGRSYEEQAEAYRKYLNGTGSLALPPGTSIHETGNAVDFGNAAWSWLGAYNGVGWNGGNANDHGWVRTVPSETWHFEYEGGGTAGGSGGPSILAVQQWLNQNRNAGLVEDGIDGPATQAAVRAYQTELGVEADGVWGPGTEAAHLAAQNRFPARALYGEAWVKAIQDKLNRLNYGPLEVDGYDGSATQDAVRRFQTDKGLGADGIAGPITNNAMDAALSAAPVGKNLTSRPTIDIQKLVGCSVLDGDYGPETTQKVMAWQTANGLAADGVWGPASDAKGFPTGSTTPPTTEWPVNGYNATTRPVEDIQKLVGVTADGSYGPLTSQAVAKWQKANGLDADGIWGPMSDLKGFPGVALPDPVVPGADATYGKKLPQYPGATWADVSPNKSVRTDTVQYFVVHHAASSASKQSQIDRFMTANDRNVSPNWFIGADGSVAEIVPPDFYRAWTTGQFDHKAVTVETQNTSMDPNWGISEASHIAIAKLVAWASKRYGFPINRQTVLGHREVPGVPATACPGPSMDLNKIVALAQEYAIETPVPGPVVPPVGATVTITLPKSEADALKAGIAEITGLLNELDELL